MPLTVNLCQLAERNVILKGSLSMDELDIDTRDEMVRVSKPLQYDLEVQTMEQGLLVLGRLQLTLRCHCVRCLKPFEYTLKLDPWACHVALAGDEPVVVVSDCVDLTPAVREDILLEFPQHPLCKPECRGLEKTSTGRSGPGGKNEADSLAWSQLDKLKL